MPRQHQTNVEFLTELMEYSRFGPMVQAFVIHCIETKAREIAEFPNPELFDSDFMSGQFWQDIAKDVVRQMDEKYGALDRTTTLTD
ncbi:hypothetical protein [Delftia sp. WSY_7]|uniref:hypothetical protein n=1 Tax=Delftia sp. WSY_7 TaxID=3367202 RepID=UPI00370CB930